MIRFLLDNGACVDSTTKVLFLLLLELYVILMQYIYI